MKNKHDALPQITVPMLHVLISLADGDKHGYAIIKEVSARTGGKVLLSPGTLYPLIRRLLEAALIEESVERPDAALDDERRRYYTLTKRGRHAAVAEMTRMEEVIEMGRAKKLLKHPRTI
jgi:DNA-binding PadR family transcriptional regulator